VVTRTSLRVPRRLRRTPLEPWAASPALGFEGEVQLEARLPAERVDTDE
jgi:hypothetical protein